MLVQTVEKKSSKQGRQHKKRHLHSLLQLSDEEESDVQISEEKTEEKKEENKEAKPDQNAALQEVKVIQVSGSQAAQASPSDATKLAPGTETAILITGATHARELLSMQVPLYICLKLIH